MNLTEKELKKIKNKPLPEVKRRIRAALSGNITAQEIIVDGCVFNHFHSIHGKINVEGKYLLSFTISKAI